MGGGGAEMVKMSIRTRDPKKSTRVPPSEEGEETRRGFKRGGGEARALTSRAILPCRDRGGWATACSRRTPWGCSCHGPGRPPPAGRPYRSCARRCGCRKPSLCRLFSSKRRRIGSVRSSFAFRASRGEQSRVQTRVKRPGARASSAVRAGEAREEMSISPLLTPSFQFGMIFSVDT